MSKNIVHPGIALSKMLVEKGVSQRELAAKINVTHALLNKILKGNRNITVNMALSLEAANFGDAIDWLNKQNQYLLTSTKKSLKFQKKEESIKIWNDIESLIPISYFKKQDLNISSSDDIDKIFEIFEVDSVKLLEKNLSKFDPKYFRKSSKFKEEPNNVFAWSMLAEHKMKNQTVPSFNPLNQQELINELKKCLYKNEINTIARTRKILSKYGIKFGVLSRPAKTPVEGKSFLSNENPAIVLSLRYKRFDNFVYNLFHELGHVYKHLTNPKYKNVNFYTNNSKSSIEEFEADEFAMNNLIDLHDWNDFILENEEDFNDEVIFKFSRKIKIHPAVIRGRVCHEYPENYAKRSAIRSENELFLK